MPHRTATNYHLFLVRLWCLEDSTLWRAMVQVAATGEQLHFTTLDDAFLFLQRQCDEAE